jgi:tetratricopeptide (TPR) repeat protein
MRRRSSILIRADDHLGDSLGVIFLLEPENYGDSVMEKLGEYFGEQSQVHKAVVSRDKIEVEVECAAFREESDRLVDAARGLRRNRLYRSAESMLRDALKLDPLNPHAFVALAEVYQDCDKFTEAIATLIRAREAAGADTPQILAMLGAGCLEVERTASAIRYFEDALALDPRHFSARRSLLALGRKPTIAPPPKREADDAGAPVPPHRKPQIKQ